MYRKTLSGLLLAVLIIILQSACAGPKASLTPELNYIISVITYLRECPEYDCKAVSELYKGDRVELLEKRENGWGKARSERTGHVGWLQTTILNREPVSVVVFYVTPETIPLREGPGQDYPSRKLLYRGEKIQKIDENDQGWWRVLTEKDKNIGWIPADLVSERFVPPVTVSTAKSAQKTYYYVASPSLNLQSLPLSSSKVVKVLQSQDKVEKLSQSNSEWYKVRHLTSGAEGWVIARYLKDSPVLTKPLTVPQKKKSKKKTAYPKPKGSTRPEPEKITPEVM